MFGRGLEVAESVALWETCKKNPGHAQFVSAQDFKDNQLASSVNDVTREGLEAFIDLTVRVRLHS